MVAQVLRYVAIATIIGVTALAVGAGYGQVQIKPPGGGAGGTVTANQGTPATQDEASAWPVSVAGAVPRSVMGTLNGAGQEVSIAGKGAGGIGLWVEPNPSYSGVIEVRCYIEDAQGSRSDYLPAFNPTLGVGKWEQRVTINSGVQIRYLPGGVCDRVAARASSWTSGEAIIRLRAATSLSIGIPGFGVSTDITSVIPGTGSNNLGKLIGNPHSTAVDVGVLPFAVRVNDPSLSMPFVVPSNGRFISLAGDHKLRLYVNPSPFSQYNTFIATRTLAASASTDYLNVYKNSGSNVVRVVRIWISQANTTTVADGMGTFEISRTTSAGSGCTAVTIKAADPGIASVPSELTASGSCTTDPTVDFLVQGCAVPAGTSAGTGSVLCYEYIPGRGIPLTIQSASAAGFMVRSTALDPAGTFTVTIELMVGLANPTF